MESLSRVGSAARSVLAQGRGSRPKGVGQGQNYPRLSLLPLRVWTNASPCDKNKGRAEPHNVRSAGPAVADVSAVTR